MNPLQKVRFKVFDYLEELDCFVINPIFSSLLEELGISGWEATAWIGRYFTLDNDYGEHWFDNWELREVLSDKANAMGYDTSELLYIDSKRFENGNDGPCHTPQERVDFWFDVVYSLEISLQTLFNESRKYASAYDVTDAEPYELTSTQAEEKIKEITKRYLTN